ncbi:MULTISPECIES: helix-turn-helix domain-containing protein [Streptomyces]|uniref:helix-turn-helix domain-containing protein n=1 Tax=Streptomyces TaxID=1883 RepID=UPI0022497286|nr:helix-turn-helix transcriptional regulator [Streptomyces sp. JHD 1]MCX2971890.1 helix-turn-helix transcriptional regulator [Streptomyces sp. JHD 1]
MARPRDPRPDAKPPGEAYGEELRIRRKAADMTQEELGEVVRCHASLIAHWEVGRRKPTLDDAKLLNRALGPDGFFTRFLGTLETSKYPDYFAAAAEAEQQATSIEEYALALVPGVLQTEGYARAVFEAMGKNHTQQMLDDEVVKRIERTRLLNDPTRPTCWFVLNETVLRTVVGGRSVMAGQLRHIAALARAGRIRAQVLPHAEGAHATMESMLSLMRFADSPELAYVEGLHSGVLMDDPLKVRKCRDAYDLARGAALSPAVSLKIIDQVAEEYEQP